MKPAPKSSTRSRGIAITPFVTQSGVMLAVGTGLLMLRRPEARMRRKQARRGWPPLQPRRASAM